MGPLDKTGYKGKRLYEPYGYTEGYGYVSKKAQIESELALNRANDKKEFASVEYSEQIHAFVFRNVDEQVRGIAKLDDIIPQNLIKEAGYDKETKCLWIVFDHSEKRVEIVLDDLIDVTEAGDGLMNVEDKFAIRLHEECERFLTVGPNGLLLSGIQDAIDVERDRSLQAEKDELNRARKAENDLLVMIMQEQADRAKADREEKERAETAEKDLRDTIGTGFTSLDNETVTSRFHALYHDLQNESESRLTEDVNLNTLLQTEANARQSGDNELRSSISSYVTRINTLESQVSSLQSQVSSIRAYQAAMEQLQIEINQRTAQVNSLQSQINSLQSQINSIANYASQAQSYNADENDKLSEKEFE